MALLRLCRKKEMVNQECPIFATAEERLTLVSTESRDKIPDHGPRERKERGAAQALGCDVGRLVIDAATCM